MTTYNIFQWTDFKPSSAKQGPPPEFTGTIISLAVGNYNNFPKSVWAVEQQTDGTTGIWRYDYDSKGSPSWAQLECNKIQELAVCFKIEGSTFGAQAWGYDNIGNVMYWPANAPKSGNQWKELTVTPNSPRENYLPTGNVLSISACNDFGVFVLASDHKVYKWIPKVITDSSQGIWQQISLPTPTSGGPAQIKSILVGDAPVPWQGAVAGLLWIVDNHYTFWGTGQWVPGGWNTWTQFMQPPPIDNPSEGPTPYCLLKISGGITNGLAAITFGNVACQWQLSQNGYEFEPMLNTYLPSTPPLPKTLIPPATPQMNLIACDGNQWIWAASNDKKYLQQYIITQYP